MESLKYTINHVFLPPKTPQEDDTNINEEHNLIGSLLNSTKKFAKQCPPTDARQLQAVARMLQRLLTVKPGLGSSEKNASMRQVISELSNGEYLVFHVRAQNAGLLLTGRGHDILVESFELLAPNENVMRCDGRLIREFPDSAATIPRTQLFDSDISSELIARLCILELEECPLARPKSRKSGQDHDEVRDTASPFLVTEMVMANVAALGQSVEPQRIVKRSREQEAIQHGLSSDLRFAMGAKLVRRIAKLDPAPGFSGQPWMQHTQGAIEANHAELGKRWRQAQVQNCPVQPSSLASLCFRTDTNLRLAGLEKHLSWMASRPKGSRNSAGPGDSTQFESLSPGSLPSGSSLDTFALIELESWIELHLPSWLANRLRNKLGGLDKPEHDIEALKALLSVYSSSARNAYASNPEALSVMHLNIMDLWVSVDRLAGQAIPLLLEYDPCFPPDLLHPLVLPTRTQLSRLQAVELYLLERKQSTPGLYPPAFANFGKRDSFAVRFFDSSGEHRNLLEAIQAEAGRTERAKIQEHQTLRRRHEDLSLRLNSTPHETEWDDDKERDVCKRWCNACSLKQQMSSLTINIFEWPLPENVTLSKAIVFEISVPKVVELWRDVTTTLFLTIFATSGHRARCDRLWQAVQHSGLRPHTGHTSQVQLASTIKSVEASHYKAKHIMSVTEAAVCVRHPWYNYDYYHCTEAMHHTEVLKPPRLPSACSFAEHQSGGYLSDWTRATAHTSNIVIAAQSECPQSMSLDEFRAFGHLRADLRLQWANILCQLIIPSLNWNREATYLAVLQACLEAGPPSSDNSVLREAHADILDDDFVDKLVSALTDALVRFRENWQNNHAVSLLACVAARVLTLTTSRLPIESLLGFLANVREVTLGWARQLVDKTAHGNTQEERDGLGQQALMAALTCVSTFDVDSELMETIVRSHDGLACLVEGAAIAHDHAPAVGSKSSPTLRFLTRRWQGVMHKAMRFFKDEVVGKNNAGFHSAIRRFWADYTPAATKWATQQGRKEHILDALMDRGDDAATSITFNVLEGRILVNGYPLSRLPREYEEHGTYTQLFGTQVLQVMPSTRPQMVFSACRRQQGWIVHFAMVDSGLVIRAVYQEDATHPDKTSEEEVWEFVPSRTLAGDVPNSFVRRYSHWLNIATGNIEFRPATTPWVSSPDNWILTRDAERKSLSRAGCYLVDPHSATATVLSSILQPIAVLGNIDIVSHPAHKMVVVDLPRYLLSFTLVEGETSIRSKHYSSMRIDADQNIGALFGLNNKLVLVQEGVSTHCSPRRIVLIPHGSPSTRLDSDRISVSIDFCQESHVKHDTFSIDVRLGLLTSGGSLPSKVYLCLLHALTSHCLPDPLTGRTGTEEALRMLRSAAIRSFQRLESRSYDLLCRIAELSPQRKYYPRHLHNMEQVKWRKTLPVLSQHDEFWPMVEEILAHARDCEVLYTTNGEHAVPQNFSSLDRSALALVRRAKIRNASFQVSEFGAENHTTELDCRYSGRGRDSMRFTRAKRVVRSIISGSQQLLDGISVHRLRQVILETTGTAFPGRPSVDFSFKLADLELCQTAFRGLWCRLHTDLAAGYDKIKIAFFISSLLYADSASWDLIQALMAITNVPGKFKREIRPPHEASFDLGYDIATMRSRVDRIIKTRLYRFYRCPEANLPQNGNESRSAWATRRNHAWQCRSNAAANDFASELEVQWHKGWTVSMPARSGNAYTSYMDVSATMSDVRNAVSLARRTKLFMDYLDTFVGELGSMGVSSATEFNHDSLALGTSDASMTLEQNTAPLGFVQSSSLFAKAAPQTQRPEPRDFTNLCDKAARAVGESGPLTGLLDRLSRLCDGRPYQLGYIDELQFSSDIANEGRHLLKSGMSLEKMFEGYLIECQQTAEEIHRAIDKVITGDSATERICRSASLYPRISPFFLFQRLTRVFWKELPQDWRECLVNYGLSLAYLQRAERLVNASRRPDRRADLLKELQNMGSHGREDGDPMTFPESLLLELEQGILIRPVQQETAAKMREPPRGNNCVMQLNMGEGKSSVIVPTVSVSHADGKTLARVVAAKPQSKQMMHTLIATLGGLINRRVFYLPISRAVRLSASGVQVVQRMLKACKEEGGVLLVQPEHLLSFKLMALESIWSEAEGAQLLGQQILTTYRNFEAESRDIVDESDENFSVKFELIYTMGTQKPIDMSPDRWTIIQELMHVVLEVAGRLANGPRETRVRGLLLEEDQASGRFPTIRVLEEAAGQSLITAIAEQICRTGLRGFPIQHQSRQMRKAVLKYILAPTLSLDQVTAVEEASSGFFNEPATKNALLLLRGLLAAGVLRFALGQKRFRVNYGLAPDRHPPTMLAVPYRAKDSPAPRSEFSHPDVVIVLTCLSYYYQGLSDGELRTCLENLSRSDQAEQEYSRWASASPGLLPSLGHFSGVNLKDSAVYKKSVFPALRYAKPAVDFYIATVVFPKEMREFPWKLSASGWDLGKKKNHPLTGFSGTTDSKYVLPLSVEALDLPEQRHTNSAVLACLLGEENNVLELGGGQDHVSALTVDMLLNAVTSSTPEMRVILDVGAQIIELSNLEVATRWLGMVPAQEADAVIFFNDHDELSVLTRNGMVDSFLTSPFATQTDRCLVFLDQAHTRGTDLKLPDAYRAAVTLGPGVTKDTLVQACMRMRKLGHGQSVTFCASPEMQKRIRNLAEVDAVRPLAVTDILVCSIAETWDDANRSLPLWATQGIRHQHQEVVWDRADGAGSLSRKDVQEYLEDEAQSLVQRFRPDTGNSDGSTCQRLSYKLSKAAELKSRSTQIAQIRTKCVEFGLANLDSMGSLQEEQERELAPEREREHQVERPPAQEPAPHALHPAVRRFASEGIMPLNSPAFLPAFQSLSSTSAAALFPLASFPSKLLVTADFARTIKSLGISSNLDAYQRPVQWLLTHQPLDTNTPPVMVVISAFEANALKPLLLSTVPSNHTVYLRAYLPRTSLSFRTLEDLTIYTIPALPSPNPPLPSILITQLNLFAGQLYLRSHAAYILMCQYLGLAHRANEGDADVAADGFVGRKGGEGYEGCEFAEGPQGGSPVGFLAVLVKRLRRDCVDVERTHLGRVLAGEILTGRDFEEEEGDVEMTDA
ncbi:hypothetical protein BT67DRAFT_490504 [Trichocladium antarcticum]|uniref:ubiquitinyl hydrolase 1 n=1 Tax=Trichocladium antarcticum TaxID=1450529 RepID=A0AAN6ZA81_9PEZI|nr:hypothetical protein BT67DRAFT_490504 [Trichocladium antarcticum]